MSDEIPVVTIEQIREVLRKAATENDGELDRQLKQVFGVSSNLILDAVNKESTDAFIKGVEHGRADERVTAKQTGAK